jgi:hypothetical protein
MHQKECVTTSLCTSGLREMDKLKTPTEVSPRETMPTKTKKGVQAVTAGGKKKAATTKKTKTTKKEKKTSKVDSKDEPSEFSALETFCQPVQTSEQFNASEKGLTFIPATFRKCCDNSECDEDDHSSFSTSDPSRIQSLTYCRGQTQPLTTQDTDNEENADSDPRGIKRIQSVYNADARVLTMSMPTQDDKVDPRGLNMPVRSHDEVGDTSDEALAYVRCFSCTKIVLVPRMQINDWTNEYPPKRVIRCDSCEALNSLVYNSTDALKDGSSTGASPLKEPCICNVCLAYIGVCADSSLPKDTPPKLPTRCSLHANDVHVDSDPRGLKRMQSRYQANSQGLKMPLRTTDDRTDPSELNHPSRTREEEMETDVVPVRCFHCSSIIVVPRMQINDWADEYPPRYVIRCDSCEALNALVSGLTDGLKDGPSTGASPPTEPCMCSCCDAYIGVRLPTADSYLSKDTPPKLPTRCSLHANDVDPDPRIIKRMQSRYQASSQGLKMPLRTTSEIADSTGLQFPSRTRDKEEMDIDDNIPLRCFSCSSIVMVPRIQINDCADENPPKLLIRCDKCEARNTVAYLQIDSNSAIDKNPSRRACSCNDCHVLIGVPAVGSNNSSDKDTPPKLPRRCYPCEKYGNRSSTDPRKLFLEDEYEEEGRRRFGRNTLNCAVIQSESSWGTPKLREATTFRRSHGWETPDWVESRIVRKYDPAAAQEYLSSSSTSALHSGSEKTVPHLEFDNVELRNVQTQKLDVSWHKPEWVGLRSSLRRTGNAEILQTRGTLTRSTSETLKPEDVDSPQWVKNTPLRRSSQPEQTLRSRQPIPPERQASRTAPSC